MRLPDRVLGLIPHQSGHAPDTEIVGTVRQARLDFMNETGQYADVIVMVVKAGTGEELRQRLLEGTHAPEDDFEVRADPRLGR
jgi:hypothetical protein